MVLRAVLATLLVEAGGFKMHQAWSTKHWCESVLVPEWPLEYGKTAGQTLELKGRTSSSAQHFGHSCMRRGAQSKCHRCEEIECDGSRCQYQLQGIPYAALPLNLPAATDTPWAVGGAHRNDFGNASTAGVCVMLSGGPCVDPVGTDYSACSVRCWGFTSGSATPRGAERVGVSSSPPSNPAVPHAYGGWEDGHEYVGWTYSKSLGLSGSATPQGVVDTIAGSGVAGFADGTLAAAQFDSPQDLTVDASHNVYVADTNNHCIRMIDPSGVVTTVAGSTTKGYIDGIGAAARFDAPAGISLYYDGVTTVLVVADTGNHRIRKILVSGSTFTVSTLAGWKGKSPTSGYADGVPERARFASPSGLAAAADGHVYVADSFNHAIRVVSTNGTVSTVSGTRVLLEPTPGCPAPCLRGVPGYDDGQVTAAQFYFPSRVAIALDGMLLVTDGHRLRRVSRDPYVTTTTQEVDSANRVVTIAGATTSGRVDDTGAKSRFDHPHGVVQTASGRIYVSDTSSCRLRRVSTSNAVAIPATCATRLVDVIRPSGCASYDPPLDMRADRATAKAGAMHYNYGVTYDDPQLPGQDREAGRLLRKCVGAPPVAAGTASTGATAGPRASVLHAAFSHLDATDVETTIKLRCPTTCGSPGAVYGGVSGLYADESSICGAAIHGGVIPTGAVGGAAEGQITLTVKLGDINSGVVAAANGITPVLLARAYGRSFTLAHFAVEEVEVQTLAGAPAAALDRACGFTDTQPPQEAKFNLPMGIASAVLATSAGATAGLGEDLTGTEHLYVADTASHRIRRVTAVCSQVCENGGSCTAPDSCTCAVGWSGYDCTTAVCSSPCGSRKLCTGPDTCTCVPGYHGAGCTQAICAQTCEHGSACSSPDTCTCATGWFDANCTTPVCDQTCGNGANCTAPDTCTCPSEWQGADCRTPVCTQTCINGGSCVAPDTCRCPKEWSGLDCSMPVCTQGFFEPVVLDPVPTFHYEYTPCNRSRWCDETNSFDCKQTQRAATLTQIHNGGSNRSITGWDDEDAPDALQYHCAVLEIVPSAVTSFSYENASGMVSRSARTSPVVPYGWEGSHVWSASAAVPSDRQIALTERRKVTQGKYVCANSGHCIAPDVCNCAAGWVGFDCRTPVCRQGYFEEGADGRAPLAASKYPAWQGNPLGQGAYECSRRAITQWMNPDASPCVLCRSPPASSLSAALTFSPTVSLSSRSFDHVNFYSRYMDATAGWPDTHVPVAGLGDDTNEGWRRDGWWEATGVGWQKGVCTTKFERVCTDPALLGTQFAPSAVSNHWDSTPTNDTDMTFRARVTDHVYNLASWGRWWTADPSSTCIDEVVGGCFNNGTCTAPDTCLCAPGWTGSNCKTPMCDQTCHNHGLCTIPNTCTCMKGWTGHDCTTPLCAQECRNNGTCVAPDTCVCHTYASSWFDNQRVPEPLFRQQNGNPRMTGWTGFDCNTPICTQGEFILVDNSSATCESGSVCGGGHGFLLHPYAQGETLTNNVYGYATRPMSVPPYLFLNSSGMNFRGDSDGQIVRNDGRSWQSGCAKEGTNYSFTNSTGTRVSNQYLCNVEVWEQGDFTVGRYSRVNDDYFRFTNRTENENAGWIKIPDVAGEGIFICANKGSCISPDVCTCVDGWTGFDCRTRALPLLFLRLSGSPPAMPESAFAAFAQHALLTSFASVLPSLPSVPPPPPADLPLPARAHKRCAGTRQ
jgi:hypothetical protein